MSQSICPENDPLKYLTKRKEDDLMLTIRNYVRAKSLEEAYELNQKKPNLVVGGMMWMRMSSRNVGTLIDLGDLGLNKIEETEDAYLIGAMTSLRQIEKHEGLNALTHGAMADAVKDIIGVQFRNCATVGGSIFGRFGFSDVLTLFLALDSYVELYKGGVVPMKDFAGMKRDRDILVRVIVKKTPVKCVYQAVRRQRTDFPTLTCAVSEMKGQITAVIGARPFAAVAVEDQENILGGGLPFSAETAEAFGSYVAGQIRTDSNIRGSAEYRKHLAKVLTGRALLELNKQINETCGTCAGEGDL